MDSTPHGCPLGRLSNVLLHISCAFAADLKTRRTASCHRPHSIYRGEREKNTARTGRHSNSGGAWPFANGRSLFPPDDDADFDSALLLDAEGKRWRVRSPRHPEASTRLETEFMVLRAFAPAIRAELPFHVPTIAGTVRQGALTTFVYAHLQGSMLSIDELSAGSPRLGQGSRRSTGSHS